MSLFKLKEVEQLTPLVGEFFHTGSRVICNPPPQDTDDDYIVLAGQGAIDYVKKILQENGWKLGGSFDSTSKNPFKYTTFVSYKKDEYNLILTHSQDYFESFKRATYLASHLNLLKKEDRVTLFEAIVRDNYPTKLKSHGKTLKDWYTYFLADHAPGWAPEPPVVAPRILDDAGRIELPQLVRNPDRNLERAQHDAMIANHMNQEAREAAGLEQLMREQDDELLRNLEEAGLEAE